jgi:sterol desaturase/sphingolipid hydroxylase (fatty acid hydroxylase superfamily)
MDFFWELLSGSDNLFLAFVMAYLVQICLYFLICGTVVIICRFMLKTLRLGQLLDGIRLQPNQVKKEIYSSLVTSCIYAAYLLLCIRLSTRVEPRSFLEGINHLVMFMLFYDFLNYFTHRLFHTDQIRKYHRHHHNAIRVTPWSSSSLHPIEAFINQIPFLLFVLMFSVSAYMLVLFYAWLMIGMAIAHSNYSPFVNLKGLYWLKRYVCFHQRHHQLGSVNYGFLGTHWDRIFGTHYLEK